MQKISKSTHSVSLVTDAPDEFSVLTAMWIIASNDENPIVTYASIRNRLNLPDDFDIKHLVNNRGELFRKGVPLDRLDEWKDRLRDMPKNRPSWIRNAGDERTQLQMITSLTPDDMFRSQFRAQKNAPVSPIQIIDWGLQHIERLRKASLETKEQTAKSKEVKAVLFVGILNVIVTIIAALLTYLK